MVLARRRIRTRIVVRSSGMWRLHSGVNILLTEQNLEACLSLSRNKTTRFRTKDNEGPDIFYVEEAQETLKHIQKIGISTLANKWVLANARPQTIDFQDRASVKQTSTLAENLLGLIKSSDVQSLSPKSSSISGGRKKTPEVTSILKRRSPEQSPVMSGSGGYFFV